MREAALHNMPRAPVGPYESISISKVHPLCKVEAPQPQDRSHSSTSKTAAASRLKWRLIQNRYRQEPLGGKVFLQVSCPSE